jgi:chitinase
VLLRAERAGNGNGRVYTIHFTASDFEGSASGKVNVCVPHSVKSGAINGGELYNSTN